MSELEFKDITIPDRDWTAEILLDGNPRMCEYSFGNLYAWRRIYDNKIARHENFLLIKNCFGYYFPAGKGDLKAVCKLLEQDSARDNKPLRFCRMDGAGLDALSSVYELAVETSRDNYDYVYNFCDLSTLAGKKLHSKRNHLNRFRENEWSYETITPQNIHECMEMSEEWCAENIEDAAESKDDILHEMCAVGQGMNAFFELGFVGGLLRVGAGGKIHAFTYGERLNSDTFVVHVEKALTTVQGTYPAINYEFVNHELQGYTYVNREEDAGSPGLRKAKLSYHPAFLTEKFSATVIRKL